MKVANKVIVVTGAGSGIGRALVLALVQQGAKVAAIDLNAATLEETRSLAGDLRDRISPHVLNVTDQAMVAALPEKVIQACGTVDGLINNAGIIQPFVYIDELDEATIEKVMTVNFYGQVHLTKAFLPHLLQRPEAHIVNVSSMGGFFPFAGQTIYGASKAAVKLFTEGLFVELLNTNVKVTVVLPGAIDTNITDNSEVKIQGLTDELRAKFPRVSPEAAAQKIIKAMQRNRYQVNIGIDSKAMRFLYMLNPRFATVSMFKLMKLLLMGGTPST